MEVGGEEDAEEARAPMGVTVKPGVENVAGIIVEPLVDEVIGCEVADDVADVAPPSCCADVEGDGRDESGVG